MATVPTWWLRCGGVGCEGGGLGWLPRVPPVALSWLIPNPHPQDYCGHNSSRGTFSVVTENVPCGTTGITCSKAIKIFMGVSETPPS